MCWDALLRQPPPPRTTAAADGSASGAADAANAAAAANAADADDAAANAADAIERPLGCCDNCVSREPVRQEDVSVPAAMALRAVSRMSSALSFRQLEKLLKGSREKRIVSDGHDTLPEWGACRSLGPAAIPRLLRMLVAR